MDFGMTAAVIHIIDLIDRSKLRCILCRIGILHKRRHLVAQCDPLVLPRLPHQGAGVSGGCHISAQNQRCHSTQRQRPQQLFAAKHGQHDRNRRQIIDALTAPGGCQRTQHDNSRQLRTGQSGAAQVEGHQHENQKKLAPA